MTSGIRFDLAALFASPSTILRVPLFLAALLLVRGVPDLLYRPLVGCHRSVVAGLLQVTSLSFIMAASQISLELGLITKATSAALIAAALLSVLIFPIIALAILRRSEIRSAAVEDTPDFAVVSETEASDLTRESTILFDLSIVLQRTSPFHAPQAGLFYILDTVVKLFSSGKTKPLVRRDACGSPGIGRGRTVPVSRLCFT